MGQIAGIVRLDGSSVSDREVALQLAPLRRAPHGRCDLWRQGPVSLAELASPPDGGEDRRPSFPDHGECRVVWDGRLFNRQPLYRVLPRLRRRALSTIPDSAVALESWFRWGPECPKHLVGEFAFAIWSPGQRSLFVARDRMGVRPFYFARAAQRFAFASQIKGLRELPGVDCTLDEDWVADYLSLTHLSRENTAYLGIKRLPPGHFMTVSLDGRTTSHRYWRLTDDAAPRFRRMEDHYGHLREITERVVAEHMTGSAPVASMLSGGLDSSAVTAFACKSARADRRRIIAVSSVLPERHPGPETDERLYIEAFLARYPDCEWVAVTAPGKHLLSDLDVLMAICDQPFRDAFAYMTLALLQEARRAGARSVLSGLGGDFFVSARGSGALGRLVVEGKWRTLRRELRRARATKPHLSPWALFRSEVVKPLVVCSPIRRWIEAVGLLTPRAWFESAAAARFADRHGLDRRQREAAPIAGVSPWRRLAHGDERTASSGLVAHLLEYHASIGMGMGVRVDCPLLDHRLVSAVANLPTELRRDAAIPRRLIREVSAGLVPDPIRERDDKGPFGPDAARRVTVSDIEHLWAVLENTRRTEALEHLVDWRAVVATARAVEMSAGRDQDAQALARIFTAASIATFLGSKTASGAQHGGI